MEQDHSDCACRARAHPIDFTSTYLRFRLGSLSPFPCGRWLRALLLWIFGTASCTRTGQRVQRVVDTTAGGGRLDRTSLSHGTIRQAGRGRRRAVGGVNVSLGRLRQTAPLALFRLEQERHGVSRWTRGGQSDRRRSNPRP